MRFSAFTVSIYAGSAWAMTTSQMKPAMTTARAAMSTCSSSMGSSTMTHQVMVSNDMGALTFSPLEVQAAVGHMVQFMFYPANHSVVQAAFDSPCMPMASVMPNMTNFYSGFKPIAKNVSAEALAMNTFTIMVKSTDPMWFYCSQGNHCQSGMVGVINPPMDKSAGQTIEAFQMKAKNTTENISPAYAMGGVEGLQSMTVPMSSSNMNGTSKGNITTHTGSNVMTTMAESSAMSTPSAMVTGTPPAATASAGLPLVPANSTGIKMANEGVQSMRGAGSPLGLLGLLAAGIYLFA